MVVALDAPPATAPSPLKVLLTPVVDDSSDDENWKREDEDKSR